MLSLCLIILLLNFFYDFVSYLSEVVFCRGLYASLSSFCCLFIYLFILSVLLRTDCLLCYAKHDAYIYEESVLSSRRSFWMEV